MPPTDDAPVEEMPLREGYVRLRYPEDHDTPDGVAVVRERHADTYLAEGFRPLTDESEG